MFEEETPAPEWHPSDGTIKVYKGDAERALGLCIGVPPGKVRPMLWIDHEGRRGYPLASFHGPEHAQAFAKVLEMFFADIEAARGYWRDFYRDFFTTPNGDSHADDK